MKKLILAAALVAGTTAAASAADLPTKAPVLAPAPIFSWTGFYVGANVGWARTESDFDSTITPPGGDFFTAASVAFLNTLADGSNSENGFTGGVQIGYNWQFSPMLVLGVEADINWLSQTTAVTGAGLTPGGTTVTNFTNSVDADWIATLRARLGLSFDRSLLYVTGGLAVLGADYNMTFTSSAPSNTFSSSSNTATGWTAGLGWEYAFINRWSVKLEYLYSKFDDLDTATVLVPGSLDTALGRAETEVHQARLGVNYRF